MVYLSIDIWNVSSGLVLFSILIFFFEEMIQVTVKCDKRVVVFEGVCKDVRCSALPGLPSMLEVLLGVKIPGNARRIGKGRFIGSGESIEEVIQILAHYTTRHLTKPF